MSNNLGRPEFRRCMNLINDLYERSVEFNTCEDLLERELESIPGIGVMDVNRMSYAARLIIDTFYKDMVERREGLNDAGITHPKDKPVLSADEFMMILKTSIGCRYDLKIPSRNNSMIGVSGGIIESVYEEEGVIKIRLVGRSMPEAFTKSKIIIGWESIGVYRLTYEDGSYCVLYLK